MSFSHRKFSCYFYFTFLYSIFLCSFFLEILLLKFLVDLPILSYLYWITTLCLFVSFFWDCSFDLVVIAFLFVEIFIYSQELGLLWKYWDGYFFIHLSKVTNVFNLNFSSISYIVFSPESLSVWFVFITVINVVGFIQMFGSLWLAMHIFLMALLIYTAHAIAFTHFKCTCQCFVV